MDHLEVAKTILSQLGGSRFVVMTGAKYLTAGQDGLGSLTMKLPSRLTINRATHCRITLMPSDTYTVQTFKVMTRKGATHYTPLDRDSDVYCDGLQDSFLHLTGLMTRFGQ